MAAAGAATHAALEVVGRGEHEVWAVKVEVFWLKCIGRVGLGSCAAFHASIVSSLGGWGKARAQ